MKRGIIIGILILVIIMPITSAGLFNWLKETVQLAPSEQKDVSVTVGNVAPTILTSPAIMIDNDLITPPFYEVDLNTGSPGTQTVNVVFRVRDPNKVDDIDLSTLTIDFVYSGGGEQTRSLVTPATDCTTANINPTTNEYDCNITMYHYDSPSDGATDWWTATIYIQDSAANSDTETQNFNLNMLRDISVVGGTGGNIGFGTLAPDMVDQTNSPGSDATITNNGNYNIGPAANGPFQITAYRLCDSSGVCTEEIPANAFYASDNDQNPCLGTQLASAGEGTAENITSFILSKGIPATTNPEDIIEHCVDMPAVSEGAYSTSPDSTQWTYAI